MLDTEIEEEWNNSLNRVNLEDQLKKEEKNGRKDVRSKSSIFLGFSNESSDRLEDKAGKNSQDMEMEVISEGPKEHAIVVGDEIEEEELMKLNSLSEDTGLVDEEEDEEGAEEVPITFGASWFPNMKPNNSVRKRRAKIGVKTHFKENVDGEFQRVVTKDFRLKKKRTYKCLCLHNFLGCCCAPCVNSKKPFLGAFLLVFGVAVACLAISMDLCVSKVRGFVSNIDSSLKEKHIVIRLLVWFSWTFGFMLISGLFMEFLSDKAVGSGMGMIKSILSGARIPNALSFNTFVSKVFGMVSCLCAGTFTGKKGSFTHITVLTAHLSLYFPVFEKIRNSPALRRQVYLAAIAGGVGIAFGAPIGGIVFAIEVTPTLYKVRDFWHALIVTIPGAMMYRFLWHTAVDGYYGVGPIVNFKSSTVELFYFSEFLMYLALGILFGLAGAMQVTFQTFINRTVKKRVHRWVWLLILVIATTCLTFPDFFGPQMAKTPLQVLKELISEDTLTWTFRGHKSPFFVICKKNLCSKNEQEEMRRLWEFSLSLVWCSCGSPSLPTCLQEGTWLPSWWEQQVGG